MNLWPLRGRTWRERLKAAALFCVPSMHNSLEVKVLYPT